MLKQILSIFSLEMGRIRPKYMGWAQAVWTMPSTVHMLREQWRCSRTAAGERRRGEGLTCGACNRWLCYWKRQAAALVAGDAVFLLSLSSVLRSLSAFLFFFFFRLFPSLFSSLLCSVSLSRSFGLSLPSLLRPLFFPFPCFYRQKQGRETWLGRPLCCRPEPPKGYIPFLLPPRGKQVGCRRLFERELAVEQKKKSSSSSPASCVLGKKKTWVPFKTTPFPAFLFFFLITVHETTSFFLKTRRFI